MSKNDMHVIAYKILRYLDRKGKTGERPRLEDFCWDSKILSIPKGYWENVVSELIDNGYVKGITAVSSLDGGNVYIVQENASITLKGSEYLHENGTMRKTAVLLGKSFEILLETVIAGAL